VSSDDTAAVAEVLRAALASSHDRSAALDSAFQHYVNAGILSKIVVHRFRCARPQACLLATVVDAGGTLLMRTGDYKLSPGVNRHHSVASARTTRTLDGNRHWPGSTFDVQELVEWGQDVGAALNCRHVRTTLTGIEVLENCEGRRPGHPGAPTRL